MALRFEIIYQSKKSRARVGRIHTPHGIIQTPGFVPVGTNGTLKAVDGVTSDQLGIELLFCNTYHLMVQPGAGVVENAGGLHTFMQRKGPIITDSGGFQVFSLAYGGVAEELKSKGSKNRSNSVAKITEEGVTFRSYKDGHRLLLTPETSIAAQKQIGADIIVSFDELPPYHITPEKLRRSLERTHRWEERSLRAHQADPRAQSLYAVVHGGINPELRKQSAEFLGKLPFDGYGIGGSVGKNREEMTAMLQATMPHVPVDKPIHLLGIGDMPSIDAAIPLGIDTFDSSHPTKCARHGLLYAAAGHVRVTSVKWAEHFRPIDETCTCYTCQHYTVAYLHHLFKAHELLFYTLASVHNIAFMMRLMANYRERILAGEI